MRGVVHNVRNGGFVAVKNAFFVFKAAKSRESYSGIPDTSTSTCRLTICCRSPVVINVVDDVPNCHDESPSLLVTLKELGSEDSARGGMVKRHVKMEP